MSAGLLSWCPRLDLLLVLSSTITLFNSQNTVSAQELPNPLIYTTPFNSTARFRSNVCDRQALMDNNTVNLENVLQGLELRAVIIPGQYFRLDEETRGIDKDYPGLTGQLMDELAERAGFTWRNSFAVTTGNPGEEGKSWSELLDWTTDVYDVSIDWWATSLDRLSTGVRFPENWYDASIIMVGDVSTEEPTAFSLWSWLKPFDYQVWALIAVSVVFSGVIYWVLEVIDKKSDKRRLEKNLLENVFLAAVTFTSHFEFKPRTNAARLFTFSLSFWALIVGAAYTANLASFLVVKNTAKIQVNSVADAVRGNLRMCIQGTTQADNAITAIFPNANLIRKGKEVDIYLGIRKGECDLAITTVSAWEFWEHQEEANGDCTLGWFGRTFKFIPAGFASKSDSGTFCTSLITDSLNIHLLRMKEDQFIAQAWETHLQRSATINCELLIDTVESDEESEQLNLKNMGGIFIVHYFMSFVAVVMAAIYKWTGWDQIPSFSKEGPNSRKDMRQLYGLMKNKNNELSKEVLASMDGRKTMMFQAAQQKTLTDVFRNKNSSLGGLSSENFNNKSTRRLSVPGTNKSTRRLSLPENFKSNGRVSFPDLARGPRQSIEATVSTKDLESFGNPPRRLSTETKPRPANKLHIVGNLSDEQDEVELEPDVAQIMNRFDSLPEDAPVESSGSESSFDNVNEYGGSPPHDEYGGSQPPDAELSRHIDHLAAQQNEMHKNQDEMHEKLELILAFLKETK